MNKLLFICTLTLLIACKKDNPSSKTCNNIQQALINNDKSQMQQAINKICEKIPVQQTPTDPDGLNRSLDELITKLNSCTAAENICYFCIKTLPAQSEIRITYNGISRVLDISYNNSNKLVFVSMHE
jgi:hypothetical protein